VNDVRAALSRVKQETDGPTLLGGWSFGAHVALRTAVDDRRPAALALVALPLHESSPDLPALPGVPEPERLRRFELPVLLLAGESDPFCPVPELLVMAGRLPRSIVEVVSGADHYFRGRERDAGRIVAAFADRTLRGDVDAQ
jgi:pimeloyl-ACP methyl ester carboxylesterase